MVYGNGNFNANLENGKKFILFWSSQWGGGNGRNTIENVRSHLSQNFPKQAIKTMHIYSFFSNLADLRTSIANGKFVGLESRPKGVCLQRMLMGRGIAIRWNVGSMFEEIVAGNTFKFNTSKCRFYV